METEPSCRSGRESCLQNVTVEYQKEAITLKTEQFIASELLFLARTCSTTVFSEFSLYNGAF